MIHGEMARCKPALDLPKTYGWPFMGVLFCSQFLLKGLFMGIAGGSALPLFQDVFGVSGQEYHALVTLIALPWASKALFGVISDLFPIEGYNKRYYVMLGSGLASGATWAVAGAWTRLYVTDVAALFTMANFGVCFVDLLIEGKYSELMQTKGEGYSGIVTLAWTLAMAGGLVAAVSTGPLADQGHLRPLIFTAAAVALPIGLAAPWIPEDKVTGKICRAKWRENKGIFFMAICLGLGALLLGLVTIYLNSAFHLGISLALCLLFSLGALLCMPREIGCAAVFLLLVEVLQVNLSGGLHYFFTGNATEYPEGPHFTYTFYNTWSSLLSAVFGMIGLFFFQRYLQYWKTRNIFYVTTLLRIVASFSDLVMVERWNVNYLHIPDRVFFLIGDAIISPVIGMMSFMPMVVLISKLCTKGTEATTYSILASYQNL